MKKPEIILPKTNGFYIFMMVEPVLIKNKKNLGSYGKGIQIAIHSKIKTQKENFLWKLNHNILLLYYGVLMSLH